MLGHLDIFRVQGQCNSQEACVKLLSFITQQPHEHNSANLTNGWLRRYSMVE